MNRKINNLEIQQIEERLWLEADFGDLVEVTLKSDLDYCARNLNGVLMVSPRDSGVNYEQRAILHVAGYYGGMREGNLKETLGLSGREIEPLLIQNPNNKMVCLDTTVHKPDAVDTIQYQGDGSIMVPVSAIYSYSILSKTRRGLRVVN